LTPTRSPATPPRLSRTDGGRDAARSRAAILEAAERLFSEHGFDGTTMAAIGASAGLSRGAPGYFFGSKEQLYRAMLGALFEDSREVLPGLPPDADLAEILAQAVGRFNDFLARRPAFLRILEWEALAGDRRLEGLPEHLATLAMALHQLAEGLERSGGTIGGGARSLDVRHLALSLIAMCLFPLAHPALVRDIGLEPGRRFQEERQREIVDLVLYGVLPR
jgi:TetR/AcrR family transcriptional regulator